MTILERELSNSDLIYIYWEQDGKWYAYEQSAFYLLAKAEVDVSRISHENIISYSKTEYVLHYTPHNGFHEWLAEIK